MSHPFSVFAPPYRRLVPLFEPRELFPESEIPKGVALVWNMSQGSSTEERLIARERAPGAALILVLPPAERFPEDLDLLATLEESRPHTVLPHHPDPDPEDLEALLARPPDDLPLQVTDFLRWRGLQIDRETRRIIRRVVDLSRDLRTVNSLARAVYLSRRALGRRFMSRGLPVPSHWLQFSRILRAVIRLQSSNDTLFSIGCELGYPDGFALSNQMKRLIGVRPSMARSHLGWEWLAECWLRQEEAEGGLKRAGREGRRQPSAGGRQISWRSARGGRSEPAAR